MEKYQYEISIEARNDKEADEKMGAISVLASKLTSLELKKLAYIIQHDPIKTAMAKKYLGV